MTMVYLLLLVPQGTTAGLSELRAAAGLAFARARMVPHLPKPPDHQLGNSGDIASTPNLLFTG